MRATVKDVVASAPPAFTALIQEAMVPMDGDLNAAFVAVVLGGDPILGMVGRVASDLDQADDEITALCERIGQRMGDTRETVRQGQHLNSVGVLQQTAHDLDRYATLRQRHIDTLKMLLHAWSIQQAGERL